jgi:DNA primase
MPDDFKETLKQQADIVRIVGDYVKLKKAGAQNYSGLCPFHAEKTPSFSVHATRQFFHCFGCGVSGDVLAFVQKIEDVSFPEAKRILAQKLGIPLPKISYATPAEAKEAQQRGLLLEIHDRAVAFFQECLRRPEGARAREYLAGRGLTDETLHAFRIGFAPDSGFLLRDRLKSDFSDELLRSSGLFSWKESVIPSNDRSRHASLPQDAVIPSEDGSPERSIAVEEPASIPTTASVSAIYSKFRNRVMFPIANDAGRVIAFTARTLSQDEKAGPKYLNSPETPIYSKSKVLFNLDLAKEAIRKLDYAILVEGQMDCISVYAAGFHNVVATSGTAFGELQARLLGRYSKNVVVNFDPDTAGARATERTLGLLVEEEFHIKVLALETGFDPDLFIRQKGKSAYVEALRNSQPYFTYLIDRARAQFPVRTAEGKVKALNHLLPHIQRVPSRIVRDELAREIAQKLAIDSAALRQELKHVATDRKAASVKPQTGSQFTDAEKVLLRALASAAEIQSSGARTSARDGAEEEFDPYRQARFALDSEKLHLGLASETLFQTLLNAPPELTDISSLPMSEDDRSSLIALLFTEDEALTVERLEGAIKGLRRIHLRRRLEQIQQDLLSLKPGDSQRMQALLQEKTQVKLTLRDAGSSFDQPARRPA